MSEIYVTKKTLTAIGRRIWHARRNSRGWSRQDLPKLADMAIELIAALVMADDKLLWPTLQDKAERLGDLAEQIIGREQFNRLYDRHVFRLQHQQYTVMLNTDGRTTSAPVKLRRFEWR